MVGIARRTLPQFYEELRVKPVARHGWNPIAPSVKAPEGVERALRASDVKTACPGRGRAPLLTY